jgi:phospholipase/carboxylesterase
MLEHLTSWPREQTPEPYPCLVLLHGRGSNEQDLFGLVPELPKQPLVVSARAPFPFPWGGFFWYDISGEQHVPDKETFDSSLQQLREFIKELPERYPIDAKRVYLVGFSQGALMSGCMTLAEPTLLAATAMLSGYLPLSAPLAVDEEGIQNKPFFMAHGTYDNVLPVTLGRQARLHLEGLQAEVEYHEYPMDHQVIEQEMEDLRSWFSAHGLG